MKISNFNHFSLTNLGISDKNKYQSISYSNKKGKAIRNLGIDLLRIISMINIIILHINSYSKFNLLERENPKFKSVWLLNALSFWSVDGFGLISGVVGYKNIKFSNLIYIWIQSSFYSIITSYYFYYKGIKNLRQWLLNLLPIAMYKYWYVNAYFCLYLFLPLINNGILILKRKFFRNLILFYFLFFTLYNIFVIIVINDDRYHFLNKGFSPLWLMILYIFGGYIGKYVLSEDNNIKNQTYFFLWIFIYILCSLFGFISYDFLLKNKINITKNIFLNYISPSIVIEAISLLLFFSKLTIKNPLFIRAISFFAPLTFNVYLFHNRIFDIIFFYDKKYCYNYIMKLDAKLLFMKIYFISIIIFIFCSFFDYIRSLLFKFIKIKNFCLFIENSFPKILDYF